MKTNSKDSSMSLLGPIIVDCLLYSGYKLPRETAAKILQKLMTIMPDSVAPTIKEMIIGIGKAYEKPREDAESYMNVIKQGILDLDNEKQAGKFDKKWAIFQMLSSCNKELDNLLSLQNKININEDLMGDELWAGYVLYRTLDILQQMVQNKKLLAVEDVEIVSLIIGSYAKAKKLLIITNDCIEKSLSALESLFKSLQAENLEQKKLLIGQCLRIMFESGNDPEVRTFIYEELYKLTIPEKQDAKYLVTVQKASSQEAFIKGSIKGTYLASEVGPLMRDLRSKIMKEMDIKDAEQLMELLVGNQIIELDLPIKLVFEKVWWPYNYRRKNPDVEEIPLIENVKTQEFDSMIVVFRLAGVDGEATERRIESIPETASVVDSEKQYAVTTAFADPIQGCLNNSGIEILLGQLKEIKCLEKEQSHAEKILLLLAVALKTLQCRAKFLSVKGEKLLSEKLVEYLPYFENEEEGCIVDSLVVILEFIFAEEDKMVKKVPQKESEMAYLEFTKKILEKLTQICERIINAKDANGSNNLINANYKIEQVKSLKGLAKILPLFANESKEAINLFANYFLEWIKCEELDVPKDSILKSRVLFHTARIMELIDNIADRFVSIRDSFVNSGVVAKLLSYMTTRLVGEAANNEAELAKSVNGLLFALELFVGICKEHSQSQFALFQSGLIPCIYKLANGKSTNQSISDLGIKCEILIEEISKNAKICPVAYNCTKELMEKSREAKKLQAEQKKNEILKQMKIQLAEKMLKPSTSVTVFGESKMEDERGFRCVVCQEGYSYKPEEILGAYIYSKSCEIRGSDNFNEKFTAATGISSVTHLGLIHLSCHLNAVKADKALKQPKGEWEGAIIRNSLTKCNNWLPIKGGSVTDANYLIAVSKYFASAKNIIKTSQINFRLIANDIKFLLKKFAYEESFSQYSHGGGPLHNIQLIPYMIQLGTFQLKTGEDNCNIAYVNKVVQSFFEVVDVVDKEIHSPEGMKIKAQEEIKLRADDFAYVLSLGLLAYSYENWAQIKKKLIASIIAISVDMARNGISARKRVKKGFVEKIIHLTNSIPSNSLIYLTKNSIGKVFDGENNERNQTNGYFALSY